MANSFADQPLLDPVFPHEAGVWECPITGIRVPKDPIKNLDYRVKLLTAADKDTALQSDLMAAVSASLLFYVNTFCFTLRVFQSVGGKIEQADNKHVPYVTWGIQDRHLLAIEKAIDEGRELLTDKSRDMGATWDHIAVYTHRLLFRPDESHLMISRNEDVVDILDGYPKNYPFGTLADPGTLFGKCDYLLSRLPDWMIPRLNRKRLHLVNLENRSRIDGESSNSSAGSSDRRTSIFLDEMAKMKEGESIKRSTKDVTACRLVCSTPNGAGTAYSKWRLSGTVPVFELPWWEHPEKGFGRYTEQDDLGKWRIKSPWYDTEALARTPKELAIEIDMDHIGSGDTFFESSTIERQRKLYARPARQKYDIKFKPKTSDEQITDAIRARDFGRVMLLPGSGKWRFWVHLVGRRLDQSRSYILSADIGKGQGASNSVINIYCVETREKIAEFADANVPSYELAKIVCATAIWVGGRNRRPLVIWENNGDPGYDFGRQLVHVYHYPSVYFDRVAGTLREKVGKRYGWRSSTEKKATALGMLRRAYAQGSFINHSGESYDEALTYVHYADGGIGPAQLVHESASTRKAHGDRVIADMLCVLAGQGVTRDIPDTVIVPERSFAHRLKQYKKDRKSEDSAHKFNFERSVAYAR